jgi:hypothetical protein
MNGNLKETRNQKIMKKSTLFILTFLCICELYADTTRVVYLSGRGSDNTVNWEFYCTGGRQSGYWTTIAVPSCWEQQGFGSYNYGTDGSKTNEQGLYRYSFNTQNDWQGKHIFLVFDGSMTDTDVKINGQSIGAVHQGAFCRFQYEITNFVRYDSINSLEVTVSKMSANASVNSAERQADYWIFGGIYRPVFLKIVPAEFIERTAINAKADGSFLIDVYLQNINSGNLVEAQIEDIHGISVGSAFSQPIASGQNKVTLQTIITNPQTWSDEYPNLYRISVVLKQGSTEIHRVKERFGFRTVELRSGNGIYINGKKMLARGVTRHCFWPKTGRTLSDSINLLDIEAVKGMNGNSIRMSHYPPDVGFLDACDEKGIYVKDELGGWQSAYDTPIGKIILKEMVTRDVNHPCIYTWDNGNEGSSHNALLVPEYAKWDPQNRIVMYPQAIFNGIDCAHYANYNSVVSKLNSSNIFQPCEVIHGLYDGGSGAGFNDHWKLMMSKPKSAGFYLWALIDEGIERTDQGNAIDVKGNQAPDGILGPYRQKEGSYYTIKEIWSPVNIDMDSLPPAFTGAIPVRNCYSFTNLNQCGFEWKLVDFYKPGQSATGFQIRKSGAAVAPDVPAGNGAGYLTSDTLHLDLPADWQTYDALYLTVKDYTGRELYTYTWPIRKAREHRAQIVALVNGTVTKNEDTSYITINTSDCEFKFDKKNGNLSSVIRQGNPFTFSQGPALCSGTQTLNTITSRQDGSDYLVEATYTGNIAYARWRINASGWIQLQYKYSLSGQYDYMGVSFNYPESNIMGITWLGRGPYRVYKNRMRGVTFNVWQKEYNNTVTGSSLWQYPEFKGYYSNVYWAKMETTEGQITVVSEDERLFLRLFTPPAPVDPRNTIVAYPKGDISFLDGIPPVGNKFQPAANEGPEGQKNTASGDYSRTLYFFFGEIITEVKESVRQIPQRFSLEQNYPNPFNPKATITFSIPTLSHVKLNIYNINGQEVATLVDEVKKPGVYSISFDGSGLASGIYFYKLRAGSEVKTKKMMLLK